MSEKFGLKDDCAEVSSFRTYTPTIVINRNSRNGGGQNCDFDDVEIRFT